MKKIVLIIIACSSILLMGMIPGSASMDDETPVTRRPAVESCLKCCLNTALYPSWVAGVCIMDTLQCPERVLNSRSEEQFFVTKIFCTMWLDSLRNGN